jgi:hypothetical protein
VLWHAILTDHRLHQAQIEAWRGRHRLIVIDGLGPVEIHLECMTAAAR